MIHTKWEYKTETYMPGLGTSEQELLKELGEQGWELVNKEWDGDWIVLLFKRPVLEKD